MITEKAKALSHALMHIAKDSHLTTGEVLQALAACQFVIAHKLSVQGNEPTRGAALVQISNLTAMVWAEGEALQKAFEKPQERAATKLANDLVEKYTLRKE